MAEDAPIDHALLGVIVIDGSIERIQEHVAVPRLCGSARRLAPGTGHAVLRQRVAARPARHALFRIATGQLRVTRARKSVGKGKRVYYRGDHGGSRKIKNNKDITQRTKQRYTYI